METVRGIPQTVHAQLKERKRSINSEIIICSRYRAKLTFARPSDESYEVRI